jgi:hypothetical protein
MSNWFIEMKVHSKTFDHLLRVSSLVPASANCIRPGTETYIQDLYGFLRKEGKFEILGTEEKFSNAKNFPPKSEAPKKNSQMPKTSRQN